MLKKLLFGSASTSTASDLMLLLLRIGAGLMMALLHGMGKVPPPDRFVEGVTALGFPAPLFFAWCAGLAELVGGIFLAIGLLTRPSAFFIGFTMFVAAFGRHLNDPFDQKEMSLLYLLICLVFLAYGGGRWSLDRFFRGKASR